MAVKKKATKTPCEILPRTQQFPPKTNDVQTTQLMLNEDFCKSRFINVEKQGTCIPKGRIECNLCMQNQKQTTLVRATVFS